MAQTLLPFCPRCGTPTVEGQRFCAKCGLKSEAMISHASPDYSQQPTPSEDISLPPTIPLPPNPQAGQRYTPAPAGYQQPPMSPVPPMPPPQPNPQIVHPSQEEYVEPSPPPLAPPVKKRGPGRVGWISIILLLLIALGLGGYFVITMLGLSLPGIGGGAGTQPPVTTTPINSTVTYAGIDITVLNAQQSQSFVDDPNTSTDGMIRLNLQEQNKGTVTVSRSYNDIAHLILPGGGGGTTVAPKYVKAPAGVAPGATQTVLLDFVVPTNVKISQLTLRLGAANGAQMDIPLTGKADLTRYQPKTANSGAQLVYYGLNWTLVSATAQLSITGQQATKGMRYIVVTLKVDNTLSQTAIPGSAYDYIHLQSGDVTASPKNTTLPVSFEAGAIGKTGTVTFLMPQQSTDFTLILVPQKDSGDKQATADFQIA